MTELAMSYEIRLVYANDARIARGDHVRGMTLQALPGSDIKAYVAEKGNTARRNAGQSDSGREIAFKSFSDLLNSLRRVGLPTELDLTIKID